MLLNFSTPYHARGTRSSIKSQLRNPFLQPITSNSTPHSRIKQQGLRYRFSSALVRLHGESESLDCSSWYVQIPPPLLSEKKKDIEVVDKDWRYSIDASIVRIMKSRMVLAHNVLVTECVKQLECMFKASNLSRISLTSSRELMFWVSLSLQPDIKVIKERIEALMERDYLERDSNDPDCLRYVAWLDQRIWFSNSKSFETVE